MDLFGLLRTLGALGLLLGVLAAALWAVRRFDVRLPGRIAGGTRRRRVELVERLAIDTKRSVALIRRDGCEHLILIGPEGNTTIETGIIPPDFASLVHASEVPVSARPKARQHARRPTMRWNRHLVREALNG